MSAGLLLPGGFEHVHTVQRGHVRHQRGIQRTESVHVVRARHVQHSQRSNVQRNVHQLRRWKVQRHYRCLDVDRVPVVRHRHLRHQRRSFGVHAVRRRHEQLGHGRNDQYVHHLFGRFMEHDLSSVSMRPVHRR